MDLFAARGQADGMTERTRKSTAKPAKDWTVDSATRTTQREPIVVEFPNPVTDDVYLSLALVMRNAMDLAGLVNDDEIVMRYDPRLIEAMDEVDPTGPDRRAAAEQNAKEAAKKAATKKPAKKAAKRAAQAGNG